MSSVLSVGIDRRSSPTFARPLRTVPRKPVSQVSRHDLIEVRVRRQEAFDEARIFRIGASELGGRRRAIRLRIAAIPVYPGTNLYVRPRHSD